ncbi:hypothetical protein BJ973_007311 [Actinoplanes tereljensis]|uniref:Uncharacterized protein n=1 Tax=Paractinoplanes tereljensis TaxID=571912 RepID=A0A919TX71_9ACTN|nr:hypothetical protein [Actinoplanes tereljensis]GIF25054.1 hypothetical protein Ate02nite_77840 [Actinoplanes tereljensis]
MFATMRRKRRSRRMKTELGQSVDHFKRAASIAAQETSATVGPTFAAAVDRVQPAAAKAKGAASSGWDSALATLTPLVSAATDNVRQAGKVSKRQAKKTAKQNKRNAQKLQKRANKAIGRKQGRSKSRLLGFALLGTAVGVGAAYAAKRRKAAQWDEYDPASQVGGADDAAFEPGEPSAYTTPNGTVTDPAQQSPR